jgi:hypothetical protein
MEEPGLNMLVPSARISPDEVSATATTEWPVPPTAKNLYHTAGAKRAVEGSAGGQPEQDAGGIFLPS